MPLVLPSSISWVLLESILPFALLVLVFHFTPLISHSFQVPSLLRSSGIDTCSTSRITHKLVEEEKEQPASLASPPCETVVHQAQLANEENGHENLGFLSLEAGFAPLNAPLKALPQSHALWDDVASQLPHLIKTQRVRATIEQLPILDASSQVLPDRYLQRAASLLGILAHTYVRLEGDLPLTKKFKSHDEVIPACLHLPWTQVCKRLGRQMTSLTYIDLTLYNYRTTAQASSEVLVENIRALIPTIDNREEHNFYGVMIEINAKTAQFIHHVIESQRAVLSNDTECLKHNLRHITQCLRRLMKVSLGKLSTSPMKKTYVDPVLWVKTVAGLPAPWLEDCVASAGTAHPFFALMDAFMGRQQYNSKIGAEVLRARAQYPPHWQQFLSAVREISVADYVVETNDKGLTGSWLALEHMYTGDEGLLGFHRRKVFGFLIVSFRIGRNSTNVGLGQKKKQREWDEVDEELDQSRSERPGPNNARLEATSHHLKHTAQNYAVHDLIQHNNPESGFWFSAQGKVYDATSFMTAHPGGKKTIALVSGQDATKDLAAVAHLSDNKASHLLDHYQIGRIRYRRFHESPLQNLYHNFVNLGYKVAEIENSYKVTMSFLKRNMTSVDLPQELNAFKAHHFLDSKHQMRANHAPTLVLNIKDIIQSLDKIGEVRYKYTQYPQIASEIEGRIGSETKINLDVDNLPTWKDATTNVSRNCQALAEVKTKCVRILAGFENLDVATETFSTETCDLLANAADMMLQKITQLA